MSVRFCARRSIVSAHPALPPGWPSWGSLPTTTDNFSKVNLVDVRAAPCHLFPAVAPREGASMSGQTMDRAAAGRFVEAWCANWRKGDIDAVVSRLAENAEM